MGEMIQRKFREMLDSVSNASDEFVNKYFSNDSVDLDLDTSSDTIEFTDDDVEVVKGDLSDDWFDYKGNLVNDDELEKDEKKETIEEPINLEKKEESLSDVKTDDSQEINIDEVKEALEENSNDEIESELKKNVTSSAIEKEIVESSIDDLNFDYDFQKDEKTSEKEENVETVEDTQYKKLSGDELIDLLNKIDNGEDFFKEIEV